MDLKAVVSQKADEVHRLGLAQTRAAIRAAIAGRDKRCPPLAEVRELVAALGATPAKVVLMPEGTTREAVGGRAGWLADVCKTEGWRFSPRMHIDLWGDKRGV